MREQGKRRALTVFIALCIQVLFTMLVYIYFARYSLSVELFLRVVSLLFVFLFFKDSRKLSNNIFYILLFVLFPILGSLLFVLFSNNIFGSKLVRSINKNANVTKDYLKQDEEILKTIDKENKSVYPQAQYISKHGGYPIYSNCKMTYFKCGEEAFPDILKELKKAKKYIFMEYFIIGLGNMWDQVLEILKQKVKEGVEVRVIYDDVGSLQSLPRFYDEELEKMGINCICFNKFNFIFKMIFNNRDHRKILIIDGVTSYTGGINIADEYINLIERFGYWKDNCIKIEGEASWNFTIAFLKMWNVCRHLGKNFNSYKPTYKKYKNCGYVAPYCSNPLKKESIGEGVYINMINQSSKYLYIMTPYLIIDNDMIKALVNAKKRGVDVKIMTPGIPDKKIVYSVTKSNYDVLLKNGIEIYEYSPGFLHSKMFLADDIVASIGTINLDYRSLDQHFECSAFIYKDKVLKTIKEDAEGTLKECKRITLKNNKVGLIKSIYRGVLKVFAPLL
ncbi:MAG: cardiolipin synthase [Bacilli bacterium]|nr:cardiolipin synthase [Bacilli bacterium]